MMVTEKTPEERFKEGLAIQAMISEDESRGYWKQEGFFGYLIPTEWYK